MDNLSKLLIEGKHELREWLMENHDQADSLWLVKWKRSSGKPYISYDEVVDELVCFGWVDSIPRKLDKEKNYDIDFSKES